MSSILDELVAFDTNEFIFALRRDVSHRSCETLLFDCLDRLHLYIPLQIVIELHHNFREGEMRYLLLALTKAPHVIWDYSPVPVDRVRHWEERGAKKGDAVIAAHLELANVRYLISENRHF